jgi:hypothetical protein
VVRARPVGLFVDDADPLVVEDGRPREVSLASLVARAQVDGGGDVLSGA